MKNISKFVAIVIVICILFGLQINVYAQKNTNNGPKQNDIAFVNTENLHSNQQIGLDNIKGEKDDFVYDWANKGAEKSHAQNNLKPISALNQIKWEKGGIYEGFSPKDEILEKRSQNTKHFRKDKGEVIGIIGPNGSGKSTLLKIMSEITAPSNGSVNIDGKVASILEVGTGFIPDLSGRKNIYLNARLHGMKKGEVDQKFI